MNQTLRQLARAYADGDIQLDEYQKNRNALIAGIVDGSVALKEIDYPPILDPNADKRSIDDLSYDEDKDEAKTEIRSLKKKTKKPEPEATGQTTASTTAETIPADTGPTSPIESFRVTPLKEKTSNTNLFIGIGAATVVAIAIGIFFMTQEKPEELIAEEEIVEEENITINKPGTEGAELVRQFVAQKRWNTNSMSSFLDEWANLSELEQRATLESGTITQMSNAIFQQFKQEQALASIGDETLALQKQKKLIDFANSIGINDERLVIAETSP